MAHAFVWHELDYNNGNITDSTAQLPYVDMGTIRQGSWNKKLFRLKWINSSVENVKLWVDSFIGDVGVLPDGLSQQSPEDLVKRYGFKYKYPGKDIHSPGNLYFIYCQRFIFKLFFRNMNVREWSSKIPDRFRIK